MRDSLRAILIDDNPDDRALVIRELRREFPNFEAAEIVDQASFNHIFALAPGDLVITDYQLRWTDGLRVLQSIKSLWPDCPVIMFTGSGSEEVAVEAMKAGLDDYVLKSPAHYARLPAVARLVLRLAQQKQRLREAEARYGLLFDSVPIGLYRATPDGCILDANPALVEMLGYPDQAALRMVNFEKIYWNEKDFQVWRGLMDANGVVQHFEAQLRRLDGQPCWAVNRARAISEMNERRLVYEGSIEDTNERKLAEVEREGLISELQDALATLKTLEGLLPICAACKKIRDDKGAWNQIEVFIQSHSDAEFTHSFCPDCARRLYPELFVEGEMKHP